ncbi:hypothetical protein G6F46_012905 [Rhizopus delemar]|uniref:Tc1-like transposase DDE domain-containing protein n=2 Tax=Rhizopus TaxID=4842 RepID=A0A9P7CHC5_9FUNG|nr:hypothetical protein G6F55_013368 [Rhizopus delemar]KAG1532549.1 hypothetical protein G6F51_013048 [Rhizopus arrhizus]KAG1484871.1 hypothetical protein G6F54_013407 [Rhizopus delemar]KAG1492060.1 hypothetical protein G6F52_013391 [Rhizopus delemar]KAG1493767.1 hypothetical protein G6F53_012696 [Rhizopus delemar]
MLWNAITYAGVGWMCKTNGNMDKAMYKETLEGKLERTIEYGVDKVGFKRHQVICQHDNDPKHTSKVPAQSPDLKPTENM